MSKAKKRNEKSEKTKRVDGIKNGKDTGKQKKTPAVFFIIAMISLTIIGGLVIFYFNKSKLSKNEDNVVAVVNGDNIYLSDIEKREKYLKAQIGPIATREFVINLTVNELLLLQEAKAQGITINDSFVEDAVNDWINAVKSSMSEAELEAVLKEQNISLNEFIQDTKDIYRKNLIIYSLLNKTVLSDLKIDNKPVQVTNDEIEQFYKENRDALTKIRVSHILICYNGTQGCTQERTKEQAKELVDSIYNMLNEGKSFTDLAIKYSDDTASKEAGGLLDWAQRGDYIKEFEDAAFSLKKINQYTMPIESPFGYHIIKLEDKKSELEDLKDDISMQLQFQKQIEQQTENVQKQEEAIKRYVEQLRAKADIKIYSDGSSDRSSQLSDIIEPEPTTIIPGIKTFSQKNNAEVCTENGKPIIRLFSTTWCPHCKWIKETFDSVAKEYVSEGKIVAYHWEMDISDNTLTMENEGFIPNEESKIFQQFSSGSVPTFVFGCKYYRIGNGYEGEKDLKAEDAEFRAVIDQLIKETNQ